MSSETARADDPLEALQACHRQIEQQLAALERLGRSEGSPRDDELRSTARAVLQFFDGSGALHEQDENHDLFPLLRERAGTKDRAVIAAVIDELEREHASLDALWQWLRQSLAGIAGGERRLDRGEVERFAWLYRRHMENEAAAVLPFAREALDRADRAALGERMAARRKMPLRNTGESG